MGAPECGDGLYGCACDETSSSATATDFRVIYLIAWACLTLSLIAWFERSMAQGPSLFTSVDSVGMQRVLPYTNLDGNGGHGILGYVLLQPCIHKCCGMSPVEQRVLQFVQLVLTATGATFLSAGVLYARDTVPFVGSNAVHLTRYDTEVLVWVCIAVMWTCIVVVCVPRQWFCRRCRSDTLCVFDAAPVIFEVAMFLILEALLAATPFYDRTRDSGFGFTRLLVWHMAGFLWWLRHAVVAITKSASVCGASACGVCIAIVTELATYVCTVGPLATMLSMHACGPFFEQ